MKLFQIIYNIKGMARDTYVYALCSSEAKYAFKETAASLGLMTIDYEIESVTELDYIEASVVIQGVAYEARENQCNS